MNRHLSAEFCLVLNAIWVAPVTAKLSSKTVISKKQKKHWKRNISNSSDMASETDQNSQRLLRTTKLRFFLSWQKVAWTKFTALALLNTVGLNNMIHFGLRGCKEQKELRWVDTVLKTKSDGKEYLEYFERPKKTRTGEDPGNQRPIKPRMYANNDVISIERIVIQCTFARCTMYKEKDHHRGGGGVGGSQRPLNLPLFGFPWSP